MDQAFLSPYSLFWKKYRPVVVKLMADASQEPQEYQFFVHELQSITPKGKNPYFTMKLHKTKAVTPIKDVIIANDLLYALSLSKKANELMAEGTYEFSLNRDYKLRVSIVETL
jgi:hypothetical protein